MYPPIYPAIAASSAVKALIGGNPVRFYQFGLADKKAPLPYAVWQRSFGAPENYLGDTPDADSFTLMVDVYASSADSARSVAAAIRDAIEPFAYITAWLGETIDPDTKNNRFTFQVDWIVPR